MAPPIRYLPSGIFRHPLQIAGRHKQQREHGDDRQQGQNGGRQASVGAGRLHLSLQPEPFADDVRQARQDFAQIAARLLLQQHRRRKEAHVQQRHAHGEIAQRDIDRRAQVLFVEQRAEFLPQRIGHLLAQHFQADRRRRGRRASNAPGSPALRETALPASSSRLLRLCAHQQVRHGAEDSARAIARGRAVEQEGHQQAQIRSPESSSSTMDSQQLAGDQFKPACWICPAHARQNCKLGKHAFQRGWSDSISWSRLLTLTPVRRPPSAAC